MWFEESEHKKVGEAIRETETIVKYYLVGLAIQIGYLTVLVGGILLAFGIKHAILIGVTFAILNLIPYVGALIGNLIGVVLTLTSSQDISQIWIVLGTIAVYTLVNIALLVGCLRLVNREASWRSLLPGRHHVAYENSTLLFGAMAGIVVLYAPWLSVLIPFLIASLHRASLELED